MYQYFVSVILDLDTHLTKAGNRRQAVSPLQESLYLRVALRNRAKHNTSVGNGLVSWYCHFAGESMNS